MPGIKNTRVQTKKILELKLSPKNWEVKKKEIKVHTMVPFSITRSKVSGSNGKSSMSATKTLIPTKNNQHIIYFLFSIYQVKCLRFQTYSTVIMYQDQVAFQPAIIYPIMVLSWSIINTKPVWYHVSEVQYQYLVSAVKLFNFC